MGEGVRQVSPTRGPAGAGVDPSAARVMYCSHGGSDCLQRVTRAIPYFVKFEECNLRIGWKLWQSVQFPAVAIDASFSCLINVFGTTVYLITARCTLTTVFGCKLSVCLAVACTHPYFGRVFGKSAIVFEIKLSSAF